MILLFHNLGTGNGFVDGIFVLTALFGWLISTFLVFRGIFRFVKSAQKSKLLILTVILFAVMRVILSTIPFPRGMFDSAALTTFPFGFFAGIPFLFIFDTRDVFVYGLLIFLGSILNAIALINFANFSVKKLDGVFE
jgi:hypothetical protein